MTWLTRMRWGDANSTQAILCEARILRKRGELSQAHDVLRRAFSQPISRDAAEFEERLIQAQSGDLAPAEEQLLKALRSERDVPEVLDALVQGYLRTGQYAKVEVTLKTWRELLPNDVRPRVLRGLY